MEHRLALFLRHLGRVMTMMMMMMMMAGCFTSAPASAHQAMIALTFDDLPGLSILPDQTYVDYTNERLLWELRRHHYPAIGFVTGDKITELMPERQYAVLQSWVKAGMSLGNHTYSHSSPNELGADAYIADIALDEPIINKLILKHGHKVWFRHPYLETGSPAAVKNQIDDWLQTHGYRIAPVTIDADDWEFAEPYDDAIARHDDARVLRIRQQYLRYTERTIGWYRAASHDVFGRDIAYVILLHDTRLNADSFNDLAAILRREKLKPVTLDKAMKDPAYITPDHYTGRNGIDWMERFSNSLHKPMPWASYRDVPKNIVEEYNKVDPSGD